MFKLMLLPTAPDHLPDFLHPVGPLDLSDEDFAVLEGKLLLGGDQGLTY